MLHSLKVASSRPDVVNDFLLPIYLILPAVLGPGLNERLTTMSTGDKMFLGSRARPVNEAANSAPSAR
jgi:hypothetical protein